MCDRKIRVRRLVSAFLKIALLTVALLASVATDAAAQGSISGRVTGPGSVPLPHPVVLWIFDMQGDAGFESIRTTSDALGNYAINLPAGSYAIITQNADGYINEIYNNIPCSAVCDTDAITPIVVTNTAVTGIDFALAPGGGRISGTVTRADGVTPIAGVIVGFIGPDGEIPFSFAVTDASGTYISEGGSVTGNVYATTFNTPGFRDEIYNNIPYCDCDPADVGATLIPVTLGMTTGAINFALDAGGSISGTVTSSSGTPLPNVEVNIRDSTGDNVGQAETDASGNYTTGGFPAGNYFVVTQNRVGLVDEIYNNIPCPGGFCDVTGSGGTAIPVTVGTTASGINFVLAPGGTISGTVTEAVGGAPVDGLFVGLFTAIGGVPSFAGGANTSGNGTGAYRIVVPPGTYFAAVINQGSFGNQIYSGLTCADSSCNPANGTALTVTTGGSINNVNFALVGRGSISGTVTVGGVVQPNIQVQVLSASGTILGNQTTIAGGVYTFSGLAVGSYYVRTNTNSLNAINQLHSGVVCVQCNVVTSGGTLVPVTANATTTINFALVAGGRISGTVTGPGGPISGMSVQIFTATGVQMGSFGTNGSGVYTSFALPAGNYKVKTASNATQNFLDEVWNDILCVPCAVQIGTNVAVAGTALTPNINFTLAAGGSISGTITDAGAGGAALSGIGVLAFDSTGVLLKNTVSDASGNYTLNGLPTGNYFVRTNPNTATQNYGSMLYNGIPYSGLPLIGTPVDVTAGATHTGVNFALVSGGSLSGTVRDAGTNAPLAQVQMVVYSPAGRPIKSPQTDLTGSFTVTGLPAGTYYVSTSVPNLPPPFYVDELYDNLPCLGCVMIGNATLPNVTLPNGTPTVTTGAPVVVTNGTTRTGVDFLLATGGGIISGVVTDAATGIGLVNVAVSVYNAAGVLVKTVTSAANTGAYIVRGLAPGTYYARTIVSPATPNYTDEAYNNVPCVPCTVTTTGGITVTANNATTGVDFALSPGGAISGVVTDAATTNPLSPVDVQLYNAGGTLVKTTFSGSVGTFRFDGLPGGTYFARTVVPASLSLYVNELYDNIPCVSCTVTTGTGIVVTNGATSNGINFALSVPLPTVVTSAATGVTSSTATLNGTVNPNGSSTTAVFQYGLTTGYGSQVAALPAPGAGTSPVAVSAAIVGLSCNTPYHFRAMATNAGGPANAADMLFTTGACPGPTIAPIRGVLTGANTPVAVPITVGSTAGPAGVILTGTSSNTTLVPTANLVFSGSGANRSLTITPAANQEGVTTITVTASDSTGTATASFVVVVGVSERGDSDGDGKADVGVYRPSNGTWYTLQSTTNLATWSTVQWGLSGDIPVSGDYDGDGRADRAVYRPSTGYWYLLNSSTNDTTWTIVQWGLTGDVPTPGDYDGDGKTDPAVYRPSTGYWYLLKSSTNYSSWSIIQWGLTGDVPKPGDYDGDGKTDVAVYRPSIGYWFLLKSSTNNTSWTIFQWGLNADLPTPADYDGDGKADMAVFRPATGYWYLLKSSTNNTSWTIFQWGVNGDVPVPADYDGDGKADMAVYRPSTGTWYLLNSSTNFSTWTIKQWGVGTDLPVIPH